MKKPMLFYLPAEEKERLVRAAKIQGRTLSEIMRRSIAAYLDHYGPIPSSSCLVEKKEQRVE